LIILNLFLFLALLRLSGLHNQAHNFFGSGPAQADFCLLKPDDQLTRNINGARC
jgi:hypothetical protein